MNGKTKRIIRRGRGRRVGIVALAFAQSQIPAEGEKVEGAPSR
jgi:hypothetical protein